MEIKEYTRFDEGDIMRLYSDAGWKAYTDDMPALRRGFERSLTVLAAYEDGELAGIIRAVGDGETVVFVQDIIVLGKFQRKGIGSALLGEMLSRYSHVRQIELVTDNTEKTKAFYRSAGFRELSEIGCCGFMRV